MPAPDSQGQANANAARILGVDPGLTATGWGILTLEAGHIEAVCGAIRSDRRAERAVRLETILDGLLATIDAHRPHAVALERPFVKINVQTAMALGQAQAMALLAAAQRSLPVYEYAPREIKQAVTGDGNADKRAVAESLRIRLGLSAPPQPVDGADALAVAYCHHLLSGG